MKSNFDPSKMAVIFLHEEPTDAQIQKVSDVSYPPDKFKIAGKKYIFIVRMDLAEQSFTQIFSNRKWE